MRYRLLESMRQYGRERLAEAGEDAAVARLHAAAILALGEELYSIFETTPERAWLARAEPELENFRAALTWALRSAGRRAARPTAGGGAPAGVDALRCGGRTAVDSGRA